MQSNSSCVQMRLPLVLLLILIGFNQYASTHDLAEHPIIAALKKYYFETPKDQEERQTTVTILGTTCNALMEMTAAVERTNTKPFFRLEYWKSVAIDPHNSPDACLELDVPDIDTKFDLTFETSAKAEEISFTGEIPSGCKDCRPKRAKSISGALRKIKKNRYRISFTGDLADTFELAPKE